MEWETGADDARDVSLFDDSDGSMQSELPSHWRWIARRVACEALATVSTLGGDADENSGVEAARAVRVANGERKDQRGGRQTVV